MMVIYSLIKCLYIYIYVYVYISVKIRKQVQNSEEQRDKKVKAKFIEEKLTTFIAMVEGIYYRGMVCMFFTFNGWLLGG